MNGEVYNPGMVLIKEGRIIAVENCKNIPDDAEVINAEGKIIIPGLIDAHCHVGMAEEVYQEGDDLNELTNPVTPHLRALDAVNPADLAFADAIRGGVTTVGTGPGSGNVIGGETLVLKTVGTTIDTMVLKQPAGLKVALGENPKYCYGQKHKMPMTRMATAGLLRETLVAAQNYYQKINNRKESDVLERDLKLESVLRVLKKEIPLRAHAHRADDILTALRIADEFDLDITIEHGTEAHKIVKELVKRKVAVVVGPSLINRAKVELKERTFRTPGILAKAGIKVALMTDHPVIPIEYLSLCAALAVKEGMTELDALKAITINPAEILGVSERVGSLVPGKDADLVVLSGSIFDVRTRVEKVMVNGEIVYSN